MPIKSNSLLWCQPCQIQPHSLLWHQQCKILILYCYVNHAKAYLSTVMSTMSNSNSLLWCQPCQIQPHSLLWCQQCQILILYCDVNHAKAYLSTVMSAMSNSNSLLWCQPCQSLPLYCDVNHAKAYLSTVMSTMPKPTYLLWCQSLPHTPLWCQQCQSIPHSLLCCKQCQSHSPESPVLHSPLWCQQCQSRSHHRSQCHCCHPHNPSQSATSHQTMYTTQHWKTVSFLVTRANIFLAYNVQSWLNFFITFHNTFFFNSLSQHKKYKIDTVIRVATSVSTGLPHLFLFGGGEWGGAGGIDQGAVLKSLAGTMKAFLFSMQTSLSHSPSLRFQFSVADSRHLALACITLLRSLSLHLLFLE